MKPVEKLLTGEVGYITASVKTVGDCRVGDTLTLASHGATEPLVGLPCRLCPSSSAVSIRWTAASIPELKEALGKLQLNDAALTFEPESSAALGFGYRCGFLGLLHLDIVQERLEREFNLTLIATAPSVIYKVHQTNGEMVEVDNPANLPPPSEISTHGRTLCHGQHHYSSPLYVGQVMDMARDRRGVYSAD